MRTAQAHQLGCRHADVGIVDRNLVDIAGFEVRSDGGHEVHGVAAAEAAMHALALAQHGVCDLHRAVGRRLAAIAGIGAEVDDDRRRRRRRLAAQIDARQRQGAGEAAERVLDEQAGDVVLLEQRLDRLRRQLPVLARQIDQVGAAIGGDDEIGPGRILAEHAVAGLGMPVAFDLRILVVGVEQRQVERFRKVERQEAHRQEILRRVVIADLDGGAGLALLGDGREAMIGRDDDVGRGGEPELVERLSELGEVGVGVLDARHRGRAIDARLDLVEAVAGIVLAAIRVARPEHQHERLVARLEHRQHHLGGDVREIGLLRDVGDRRARRLGIARLGIVAAWRRGKRKAGLGQGVLHLVRQCDTVLAAGGIVEHHRMRAGLFSLVGVVELVGRADLADRGGAEALVAGHLQNGLFIEVVALEVLVDVAEHGVVLDEGDDGVTCGCGGVVGPDRVGEHAGVAEIVAGRHRRAVGHGEGREERMRVFEVDALVADLGHCGCRLRCDLQRAKTVGNEQDQVAGRVVLGGGKSGGQHGQSGGQQHQ